jgi:DNA repair protein RadD
MLRDYQQRVVSKIKWALTLPGNDIICVAQGGGKSHIIADIANHIGKVLVICPNKEILEQNLDKLLHHEERHNIGVYSASMNEKVIKPITIGTIQSMYKHPELFRGFDIVIYDECDLHNPKKMSTMSNKLFKEAGISKVFGFTGTPFRQDHFYKRWGMQKWQVETITTTKMINRYASRFWERMLIVVNTDELMDNGYLCPIEYHDFSLMNHRSIPTNKSKSDFDLERFDSMITDKHLELAGKIKNIPQRSKLVFCATIKQAEVLSGLIPDSEVITSNTTKSKRAKAVKRLKKGELDILFNVGIYTVGFDYPELDCIILLRPTRSLRLHCQILGRVTRKAEGKEVGHVYDFVSNVRNLGKLEDIRIEKIPNARGTYLWNVTSPAFPNGFHMEPLYKYKLKRKQ